jgi:hypothetical protein
MLRIEWMNYAVRIATEQGLAFLVGLALVSVVVPATPGGALLLILVAVAIVNLLIQAAKFVYRQSKINASEDSSSHTEDNSN